MMTLLGLVAPSVTAAAPPPVPRARWVDCHPEAGTRYEGAVLVDELLPNSALPTVEGWGHTSIFLSACADQAVAEYLLRGVVPEDGATCAQDIGPFETAPALRNADQADRVAARAEVMSEIALIPGR